MIKGDPKSLPPAILNPHGVLPSVRSILALKLMTDMLAKQSDPKILPDSSQHDDAADTEHKPKNNTSGINNTTKRNR